jgi:hypothetical protein
MPLNTNIPLGIRPFQLEGPLDQATKILPLMQMFEAMKQQQFATQQKQRLLQQDDAMRQTLSQTGGDIPKAIQALIAQGPEGVKLAGVLAEATKDLRNPQSRNTIVPQGSTVLGPDNTPLYTNPAKPDKPEANPEIVKLTNLLQTLPQGHPQRSPIEARIKLLTTREPGVTVNMPASSDLMYDEQTGQPVRVRIGKDGKVEKIPLTGLRQPPTAAERKEEGAAAEGEQTIASVRARVAKMANLIQGGAMAGATVGPLGLASRVGETVVGSVKQDTPTPAIDYQNEQRLLLSEVRKLVEKDSNLSNQERQALYETLGGGITQTPGSAIRTLNNVLSYVEGKKVTGKSRAASLESSVKAAGWNYEPDKYDYRVMDGKVQRKAK